jgi:hypothetical protein
MGCVLGQHDDSDRRKRAIYYLSRNSTIVNPGVGKNLLRTSLGSSSVTTVYVVSHNLADLPINDYEPMMINFPDEDVMALFGSEEEALPETSNWRMYFDGAANALGYGIGEILVSPKGMQYPIAVKFTFPCTNNITLQSMKSALLGYKRLWK